MSQRPIRPRRPAGTRPAAGRPRKVAGQGARPVEPVEPVEPVVAEEPPAEEPPAPPPPSPLSPPARPARRRVTVVLAVLLVVLLAVAGTQAWYLWLREPPTISGDSPVVVSQVTAAGATDTAARALAEIVSTSYRDYDEQVEAAVELMTPSFAEEYRQTAGDVRESILTDQTEVTAAISQQGVVTASREQVQALVFLDQTVAKNGTGPSVTPYRALVTVVRSGDRWLVSAIDTQ